MLGEVEKIGAILTGDPVTNHEAEYNIGAGAAHQEVNRERLAAENQIENEVESDAQKR